MIGFKIKILDKYIIGKFLTTFFFALGLIILIAIVFDVSEKIDDFLEKKAPFQSIVFDYYLNFILTSRIFFLRCLFLFQLYFLLQKCRDKLKL